MRELKYKKSVLNYFITIGDILSTLVNHAIFLSFDGNQSFSGRCFENRHMKFFGIMRKIIDFALSRLEKNHCEAAFISDGMRGEHMSRTVQEYLDSAEFTGEERREDDE